MLSSNSNQRHPPGLLKLLAVPWLAASIGNACTLSDYSYLGEKWTAVHAAGQGGRTALTATSQQQTGGSSRLVTSGSGGATGGNTGGSSGGSANSTKTLLTDPSTVPNIGGSSTALSSGGTTVAIATGGAGGVSLSTASPTGGVVASGGSVATGGKVTHVAGAGGAGGATVSSSSTIVGPSGAGATHLAGAAGMTSTASSAASGGSSGAASTTGAGGASPPPTNCPGCAVLSVPFSAKGQSARYFMLFSPMVAVNERTNVSGTYSVTAEGTMVVRAFAPQLGNTQYRMLLQQDNGSYTICTSDTLTFPTGLTAGWVILQWGLGACASDTSVGRLGFELVADSASTAATPSTTTMWIDAIWIELKGSYIAGPFTYSTSSAVNAAAVANDYNQAYGVLYLRPSTPTPPSGSTIWWLSN